MKKNRMKKLFLALFLCLAMMVTLVTVPMNRPVYAEGGEAEAQESSEPAPQKQEEPAPQK